MTVNLTSVDIGGHPHTATYIHKNLYSEYGLYNESYKISGDYDFFCRIPRNVIQQFIRIRHTLVIQRNGGISTNPMNFLKKIQKILG